jgi:hypothetical protein
VAAAQYDASSLVEARDFTERNRHLAFGRLQGTERSIVGAFYRELGSNDIARDGLLKRLPPELHPGLFPQDPPEVRTVLFATMFGALLQIGPGFCVGCWPKSPICSVF